MRHEINSLNTKTALSDAMKKLTKRAKFSKITINELCDYCNVNRNTFYYHFPNIHQLILWTLHNDFYQFFYTVNNNHTKVDMIRDFIVNYLCDNSKFLNYAYYELGHDVFTKSNTAELHPIIEAHIAHLEHDNNLTLNPEFKKMLVEFYAEQVTSVYLMLFRTPSHYSKPTVRKFLQIIFDYTIPDIIKHQDDFDF